MKKMLACLPIFLFLGKCLAQHPAPFKEYDFWVKKLDEPRPIRGSILQYRDSAVVFKAFYKSKKTATIPIENIENIQFRRKRSPNTGFWLGTAIGTGLGIKIGLDIAAINLPNRPSSPASPNPKLGYPQKKYVFAVAVGGAIMGGLLGRAIGLKATRIKIKGKNSRFQQNFLRKIQ